MKFRTCLVSNSSSSSFFITNNSDTTKTMLDFITELREQIEHGGRHLDVIPWKDVENSAKGDHFHSLEAGKSDTWEFEDNIGLAHETMLRLCLPTIGKTESFSWNYLFSE